MNDLVLWLFVGPMVIVVWIMAFAVIAMFVDMYRDYRRRL